MAGLLSIGACADADGLFEAVGARLAGAPLSPRALLAASLGLVAVVTALLNLDTAVVFLTPVLLHAARRRRLDERPFVYGSVLMANSASLLLPGSNLTNLLVLRGASGGLAFAGTTAPAWLAACALTVAVVAVAFPLRGGGAAATRTPPLPLGLTAATVAAAAALVVVVPDPALPVLALGLAACLRSRVRPRVRPAALLALFSAAVGLGVLARAWDGPAALLRASGSWETAGVGAAASVVLNNLPAAVLLSARPASHPVALLLGLDLGPNLAVTGSLAAFLWLEACRANGVRPSLATYSRFGAVLAPLSLAAALLATHA